MNKKILCVCALLFPAHANASDLPSVTADTAAPVGGLRGAISTSQNWNGAYVGVAIGGTNLWDSLNATGADRQFGMFAGYNLRLGPAVIGAEVSADNSNTFFTDGSNIKSDKFYNGRIRLGVTNDIVMAYGSIGLQHSTTNFVLASGDTAKDTGLQLGAGLEYAINKHLTIGGEYTHVKYKSFDNTGIAVRVERLIGRMAYNFN